MGFTEKKFLKENVAKVNVRPIGPETHGPARCAAEEYRWDVAVSCALGLYVPKAPNRSRDGQGASTKARLSTRKHQDFEISVSFPIADPGFLLCRLKGGLRGKSNERDPSEALAL